MKGHRMKAGTTILTVLASAVLLSMVAGCGSEADADSTNGQQAGSPEGNLEEGLEVTVEDVSLTMSVDGQDLSVSVSAPTTGWVAVGFDASAAMKDANIVIGYVEDGQVYIRDDWGSGHTSHEPDTDMGGSDDISAASGDETDGTTTISFTIPLDSGTPGDKPLVPGNTVEVLLAYGPDDADDFDGYHRWAEVIEVEF
jgi:hypothetical protein